LAQPFGEDKADFWRPAGREEDWKRKAASSNCGGGGRDEEKVGCCCCYGEGGLWKEVGYQSPPPLRLQQRYPSPSLWLCGSWVGTSPQSLSTVSLMCARCARAGGVGASSPQMRRANANETGLCGASRGRCYCGKQASKR
jgi:hypothetical protein